MQHYYPIYLVDSLAARRSLSVNVLVQWITFSIR